MTLATKLKLKERVLSLPGAEEFGVEKSTVHDTMKQQDKIIDFVAEKEGESADLSRKNMRVADDTLLDKSL